jgi:thioredoxin reductase
MTSVDVVIIGAGPAGLSAALNLVRARRRVVLVDSNRPRNSATFHSHGFMTRDGVSPLELRRLGREELDAYPEYYEYRQTRVGAVAADDDGFTVAVAVAGGGAGEEFRAENVIIATGVAEIMPQLPSIRAFYGTSLHSCMDCDGFEHSGQRLALIGETDDLTAHALLLSQWSEDIIVFTNAVGTVSDDDEELLAERRILVDRRPISDVSGDQTGMTGVTLADGASVPRQAGFIRPRYQPQLAYADSLGLAVDGEGYLIVDGSGRTSLAGVYAAGDAALPGPQQLIIAAGAGARVAATINRDLAGVPRR